MLLSTKRSAGRGKVAVIWSRSKPLERASLALGLLVAAAVFVAAFNAMRYGQDSPTLYPAAVPSMTAVCTAQVHKSGDGSIAPVFCDDGSINQVAWRQLAADDLKVLRLGRRSTPADVIDAITADLKARETGPRECSAALLAAAYYGWTFHINPVVGLTLDCAILK